MTFKHAFLGKHAILGIVALCAIIMMPARAAFCEPLQIVGFGDSLMAGYRLGPDEGFTYRLQEALRAKGHDVVVTNAGVSGDTTSGGLARLDWSIADGTQLVILELGANDMLRGVTPEITEKNLDTMLSRLKDRKITVLLVGMLAAPNLGTDYQKAFDAIYPELSHKYGAALYPFFLDGVAGEQAFQLDDGMHPNAAGIDRMVERILPTVEQAIASIPDGS